jgi:hypothetical protein
MYAGQLDSWKKPEFLVDMMEFVTESNVSLCLSEAEKTIFANCNIM